ncbi:MAG: hypothetical protein HQ522_06335 [Bacteroidetes bacterium]|nr:hypothetical protein [Bacteroidota bacterium]
MKKLMGKLSDFWTIPLAIIIASCYNYISTMLGLFSMTPEKIGKVVPATVLFLLALGISRLLHTIQYPDTYQYGLMKKSNQSWADLSNSQKFLYSWLQRAILFLGFVGILSAM